MATGRKFKVGDIVRLTKWYAGLFPGTQFEITSYTGNGHWVATKLTGNSTPGWIVETHALELTPEQLRPKKKVYDDGLDNWE